MFPVPTQRDELPRKEWAVGIIVGGEAMAFPLEKLKTRPKLTLPVVGTQIRVNYDPNSELVTATGPDGSNMPVVTS